VPYPWSVAVVDDDREARLSLGSLMRSYGIKAEVFASAEALLGSAHLAAFDCLITDVHMPGLDGLGMIEAVRSLRGPMPVIVISALDEARTRARAAAIGADAFLAKPVDSKELMNCIRRLLGNGTPPD